MTGTPNKAFQRDECEPGCVEVFSGSPDSFLFVFEFGKVAEHSNAIPKDLVTLVVFFYPTCLARCIQHLDGKYVGTIEVVLLLPSALTGGY